MEKMQLGSPASPGQNSYLPSYLMGVENQTPARNLSFSNSPTASPDFNRSNVQQKFFSGLHQQSPGTSSSFQQPQQQFYQAQNPNSSTVSGAAPPAVGLFDYLKNDKSFQTPTKNVFQLNQSQSLGGFNQHQETSIINQSGFNQSRIMSPIPNMMGNNQDFNHSYQQQQNATYQTTMPINQSYSNSNNFWITIFGFPQSATSAILSHFAQCGTILEKVCSSGNWIHLRFSSRLECDKALIYNGKIIGNNLMIGVTRCTDEAIHDKENAGGNQTQHEMSVNKIRSLTQAAYKSAQGPTEVVQGQNAPKRATGIVNKAMDLFFGW